MVSNDENKINIRTMVKIRGLRFFSIKNIFRLFLEKSTDKRLKNTLRDYLQLPNIYNIQNSIQLMGDLKSITINKNTRLCSFDIVNVYTNIPKNDIITITKNILQNYDINIDTQKEIIQLMNTLLEQNYFQHDHKYYKQTNGLAMGAPTSAILAEIYIQNTEHTQIYDILIKQHIIAYFRYVDDILIVYDSKKTNIDDTINDFNKLQPKIKFTIEKENKKSINFSRYWNT
jgi:hypothetical protein